MKTGLLLRAACGAVAGFFLLLAPFSIASAAAPQLKTSAPGYYPMMLGDFEVTALSDGTVDLPMAELLTNITPPGFERTSEAVPERSGRGVG